LSYLNNALEENPRDPYTTRKTRTRLRQETGRNVVNGRQLYDVQEEEAAY
jgi:hypothetical protein